MLNAALTNTTRVKNRTIMSILPTQNEFRFIMNAKGWLTRFVLRGAICMLILCCSCGESDRDKNILTKAQMVKAMTEIYLAEQKINRLGVPRDSAEHEFERFKQLVFEKIDVKDSVFKRSFNYYMDRPKDMEFIFTALVDSLSLMEQRMESVKK
jgi:hypothetical protein